MSIFEYTKTETKPLKSKLMTTEMIAQEKAYLKALSFAYKTKETKTTYIFTNSVNMWVELRKTDGSYVNGNYYDNEITQMLFRKLYKMATSI